MRTVPRTRSVPRGLAAIAAALIALIVGLAGPAQAQYGGGGITFFPDPRVPIDQTFSVFGSGCAAGSTVEISIDGIPGVLATTTASAAGNYAIADIDLPPGLIAGTDLDVRATCGSETTTGITTLLCPSGDLPVDGDCEDGSDGIVGGSGPTTTTTTTPTPNPGDGSGDDGGSTSGGTPDDGSSGGSSGGSSPDLAITGASFSELLVQLGVTLFALGFVFVLAARRRRPAAV